MILLIIFGIPLGLILTLYDAAKSSKKKQLTKHQNNLINKSIYSRIYGKGKITSQKNIGTDYQVTVQFENSTPIRQYMYNQALQSGTLTTEIQYNNIAQQYNNCLDYKKVQLLTDYETKLYKILDEYSQSKNYRLISKVRLADLINQQDEFNYSAFNKISRKHIDFAICEPERLTPLLIIELDDKSHNNENRRARDDFVNQSLVQAGYKILHIRNIENDNLFDTINNIINSNMPSVYYI